MKGLCSKTVLGALLALVLTLVGCAGLRGNPTKAKECEHGALTFDHAKKRFGMDDGNALALVDFLARHNGGCDFRALGPIRALGKDTLHYILKFEDGRTVGTMAIFPGPPRGGGIHILAISRGEIFEYLVEPFRKKRVGGKKQPLKI
ncbi:MAG: hypothetical protein ACE5JJ_06545 [Nitrospinota bacterium]